MEYVWLMVARELAKGYIFPNDTRHPIAPCARDSDWIARELGDVPHETIGGWHSAAGTRTPWFNDCIPVESLGRDA